MIYRTLPESGIELYTELLHGNYTFIRVAMQCGTILPSDSLLVYAVIIVPCVCYPA